MGQYSTVGDNGNRGNSLARVWDCGSIYPEICSVYHKWISSRIGVGGQHFGISFTPPPNALEQRHSTVFPTKNPVSGPNSSTVYVFPSPVPPVEDTIRAF